MKHYEVRVRQIEYGFYRIRAKDKREARRIARQVFEKGRDPDCIEDVRAEVLDVSESSEKYPEDGATARFFDKVDVPQ